MMVRIEYEGGRAALFDTLSFTEGSPFSGANMLTEFELEMREEPEKGLWLTVNWHQVRDDWRADAPADGIPAARRSKWFADLSQDLSQTPTRRHAAGFGGMTAKTDEPTGVNWNGATTNEYERVGVG